MLLANFRANLRDLSRAAFDELGRHLFPGAALVIDETHRTFCAVPGRPHFATDGRLCREHLEEIGVWLHDIETEANRLDTAPSISSRLGDVGGGSLASQQSPVVLAAVVFGDRRSVGDRHLFGPVCARCDHQTCESLRDERGTERLVSIYAVLHRWAQRTRDERLFGIPVRKILVRVPPGHEGPYVVDSDGVIGATTLIPESLTIATERDILTRQLGWIAGRDWIEQMRDQLEQLRNQLLRHNRNAEDRPLSGWCYRIIDGEECGGKLLPAAPAYSTSTEEEDDDPERPQAIACERNPMHRWEGRELARLSLILEKQRRDERLAAMPPPAPSAPPQLRVVSTAGQGSRLDPVLEEQRLRDAALVTPLHLHRRDPR